MKFLLFISFITYINVAVAQTTPPPPYNPATNNALSNNSVNNNTGTPMVKNPVESNNPSVQASIPLNSKPSSLEVDNPQNNIPEPPRVVNNYAQQNTTVKNKVTEGTQNSPTVVIATSVANDTLLNNVTPTTPTNAPVAKTMVVYSATTGIDASKNKKPSNITLPNGNTSPIRQTYVSETVVTKFKNIYGDNLYDIRFVRSGTNDHKYIVRIIDNGVYRTMYLNEEGVVLQ